MTQTAIWTVEAYFRAVEAAQLEEAKLYELVDGELLEMASPPVIHQLISRTLFTSIDKFVVERKLGETLFAPVDVVLSPTQKPIPDLVFVSNERLDIVDYYSTIQGAPDLLVEILSPSTADHDRTRKRRIYSEAGVLEYWLIDIETQSVQVLKLENGSYSEAVQPQGRLKSAAVLPGFSLELAQLFRLPERTKSTKQEEEDARS